MKSLSAVITSKDKASHSLILVILIFLKIIPVVWQLISQKTNLLDMCNHAHYTLYNHACFADSSLPTKIGPLEISRYMVHGYQFEDVMISSNILCGRYEAISLLQIPM